MTVDLYHTLLKNTEQISFGVNPVSVILKPKGEVVVKTKKLSVIYDGEQQEPIDCRSVEIKFEGDNIILNIVPVKIEEQSVIEDAPQAEAVIPATKTDTFMLMGDDLESLELLSDFRKEENLGQKTANDKLEAYTLESGVFDIQDLTSVQNAMLDIIEKEKQFIDQGYRVFKANIPRFDYENSNDFKLIESVVLITPTVEVVEEK